MNAQKSSEIFLNFRYFNEYKNTTRLSLLYMVEKTNYTLDGLLEDTRFIAHVNRPSPESESFWAGLIAEGCVSQENFDKARAMIRSVRQPVRDLTSEETAAMWARIQAKINAQGKRRNSTRLAGYLLSAACVLSLVFLVYKMQSTGNDAVLLSEYGLKIEDVARPDSIGNNIQIIFSENGRMEVAEESAEVVYDKTGKTLVNQQAVTSEEKEETPSFNQIIVPTGRHLSLTLADGTKIWLNACSRVVYPSVFIGKTREIYLEGEAYLEVSHNANRPFTVKTRQMDVNVLGTSFDVSAYEDEATQSVVLVSGSVAVKTHKQNESVTLTPNRMFALTGDKTVVNTVDVNKYISWKDGLYVFRDERLSFILKRLSHYYGIKIEHSPEVGEIRYTGKLDLKDDAERVLRGFSNTAPVICKEENEIYTLMLNH
jgi:ferric-dicitrate binding protein FerR (iron transport regulator)